MKTMVLKKKVHIMFNPKTYLMTSLVQSLDCPEALCVSTTKRESLNSRIRFQPHMWVQLVTVLKQRPVVSQSVCVEKRVTWEKTFKQWKGGRMADSLGNCCSYQPPNHMGGATSAAGETYLHLPVHSLQNSEKLVHFITQISTYSPPPQQPDCNAVHIQTKLLWRLSSTDHLTKYLREDLVFTD